MFRKRRSAARVEFAGMVVTALLDEYPAIARAMVEARIKPEQVRNFLRREFS